jgi:hypothetical protein
VPALNKWFVVAGWLLVTTTPHLHQRPTPWDRNKLFTTVTITPENKVKHKGAESLGAFILFGVTDNSVEICQILEKKMF